MAFVLQRTSVYQQQKCEGVAKQRLCASASYYCLCPETALAFLYFSPFCCTVNEYPLFCAWQFALLVFSPAVTLVNLSGPGCCGQCFERVHFFIFPEAQTQYFPAACHENKNCLFFKWSLFFSSSFVSTVYLCAH